MPFLQRSVLLVLLPLP